MANNFKSTINFKSSIEELVDRLFSEIKAKRGQLCVNPVTGGNFVWGIDRISTQKKEAIAALGARQWFAENGPSDAPPLPLSPNDIEDYRIARGLAGIVGFYARSLLANEYDIRRHPSFEDFASGLMACDSGLWGIENDENLKRRFPPRPLNGMGAGLCWEPPRKQKRAA
jgi:hypothetical protein